MDFSLDLENVRLEKEEEKKDFFLSAEILSAEKTGGCSHCKEGMVLNVNTGEISYDYEIIYSLSILMGYGSGYTVQLCEKCRNDLIHYLIEMGNLK